MPNMSRDLENNLGPCDGAASSSQDTLNQNTVAPNPNMATGTDNNFTVKLVAELQQKLRVMECSLQESEQEKKFMQIHIQGASKDILENKDVKGLIQAYKDQIKCLEDRLVCLSSNDNALRIADENKRLNMRNTVLACTNASIVQQCADLQQRINASERANDELHAQISSLKSTSGTASPSQCHPGSDVGQGPANLPAEDSNVTGPSVDNNLVNQLKGYLAEYYKLLIGSRNENRNLQEEFQCTKTQHEDNMKKLIEQMQVVVQERDQLQTKLQNLSHTTELQVRNAATTQRNMNTFEPVNDHYKNLVIELQEKNRHLKHDLAYKDSHILEQEVKIEKMVAQNNEAKREIDDYAQQLNQAGSAEVQRLQNDIKIKNQQLLEMSKSIDSLKNQLAELKCENDELKSKTNPDDFAVREQLKAFQDDYFAEREEKKRIIEQSRRLQQDNDNLMHELQNRVTVPQSQFSSPPPGPNPTFEGGIPHSPPIVVAHRQQLEYASYPAPGQGHQRGEFHGRQPIQAQGTMPAYTMYPAYSHQYNERANTIPPRRGNVQQHAGNFDRSVSQYSYTVPYNHDQQYYHQTAGHDYPTAVPYESMSGFPVPYGDATTATRPRMPAPRDVGGPAQGRQPPN